VRLRAWVLRACYKTNMNVDVVLLPAHLQPGQLVGRTVVVFDVLRATTTMTAALASLDEAREAAGRCEAPRLLCGEANCLAPAGFDLGNSPGDLQAGRHRGLTAFMCTTNGTRAILAAREAQHLFVGALVNASHVAEAVVTTGGDVTLLCAGTQGTVAMEDVIGAGAVLHGLLRQGYSAANDIARMAVRLFDQARPDVRGALAESRGGRNVEAAGLVADIDFAARLDELEAVGVVQSVSNTPAIRTFV
jgi:2-phosphosulfolactate phosphatase